MRLSSPTMCGEEICETNWGMKDIRDPLNIPFLSVIIPAYNEEITICRTVDSLLRQDYSCFEIIVVDDGSEDNTGRNLIDRYGLRLIDKVDNHRAPKHKPIAKIWNKRCDTINLYLAQKENGGKGDALNAGLCFCHGDYFACIDADCTFPADTLSFMSKTLFKESNIVAVGGRVLPITGLPDFFQQKGFRLQDALQGCQELEYGIAFCIVRPIFDRLGTSMLISGALGIFERDVVIRLGGYALDTVGEDMELVMRIRQFAAENDKTIKIAYTETAVCFTEIPRIVRDLRKQRIRWTVGLTEVLWKYREMATCKKYSFLEKLTFWYYVLFEKFSPHIELIILIMCIILGIYFDFSQTTLILITTTVFRILLSIVGSFHAIKNSIKSSENKFRSNLKLLLLIITFVSIYHLWNLFYRLIAVPSFRIIKRKTNNQGSSWVSPARI